VQTGRIEAPRGQFSPSNPLFKPKQEIKMHFRTTAIIAALAAFQCAAPIVHAQETEAGQSAPVAAVANPSNELFAKLKAQCNASGCDQGSGDVCADAAALITGENMPDALREMSKDQQRKIAIRLLERGAVSSNRARAMAYDLYIEGGFLGSFSNSSADPVRAEELLELMVKSGFVGGVLRQIRDGLVVFSSGDGTDKNVNLCKKGRAILAKGGLDEDSLRVANEIDNAFLCDKANAAKK
jgi:hypothetical protein